MTRDVFVRAVVAAPLGGALVLVALLAASGAAGVGPFAPDPPRNVAEALALGDAASAVRMFRAGADPLALYEIRPRMLAREVGRRVRPLAAAGYTSDDMMVRIAQQAGARLPPDEARTVACWLRAKGRDTVAKMLAPEAWSPEACPPLQEEQ